MSSSWTSEAKKILTLLKKFPDADPFLYPVDWKGFGLDDYPKIIKKPMDLSTIATKLSSGDQYEKFGDFEADFRLIVSNCKLYNAEKSEVFEMAESMEKEFDRIIASLRDWREDAKKILNNLKKNPNAIWFLEPVDWKGLGLKDYLDVVKVPMDLGTVSSKLASYENMDAFWSDVDLIWTNCMKYNADGSEVFVMAENMKRETDKLRGVETAVIVPPTSVPSGRKRKSEDAAEAQQDLIEEGKRDDMIRLGKRFGQLEGEYLSNAIRFVYSKCPQSVRGVPGPGNNTVDVDLETLMKSESAASIYQLVKVLLYLQQNPGDE